ncbi:MAG: hypothetical protein HC904_10170 [Blastochloris sp.]|nr:hypothetical protein [Blastochloris sp.]
MIYDFTLQQVSFVLGLLYILSHGYVLLQPKQAEKFLLAAPRHAALGVGLMVLATLWFTWLMVNVDLMEWHHLRRIFVIAGLVGGVLVVIYMKELLTGRALGVLLLLAAYVLLDAAFLRDEPLKLLVVVNAYAYVIAGMFLAASPYYLRDVLSLFYRDPRWMPVAAGAGVVWGGVLLVLACWVF